MIRFGLKIVGLGVLLAVCVGIGAAGAQLLSLARDPDHLALVIHEAGQFVDGGVARAGVKLSSDPKEEGG